MQGSFHLGLKVFRQQYHLLIAYISIVWMVFKKNVKVLEQVQRKNELVKDLVGMSCQEQLRTLGLSNSKKRKLKDGLIICSLASWGGKWRGWNLLPDIQRQVYGNGPKLHQRRLRLDVRKLSLWKWLSNTGKGITERWSVPFSAQKSFAQCP